MDDFWSYTAPATASLFTYSRGKLFYHIGISLFLFLFDVKLLKTPKAKHAGQAIVMNNNKTCPPAEPLTVEGRRGILAYFAERRTPNAEQGMTLRLVIRVRKLSESGSM